MKKYKGHDENTILKKNDQRHHHGDRDCPRLTGGDGSPDPGSAHHQKNPKANPGILDWLIDPQKGLFSPLKLILTDAARSLFPSGIPSEVITRAEAGEKDAKAALDELVKPGSPITPEDAAVRCDLTTENAERRMSKLLDDMFWSELFTFGQVDMFVHMMAQSPRVRALIDVATGFQKEAVEQSIMPALKRFFLKRHLPLIPGPGDLIRMVMGRHIEEPAYLDMMAQQGYAAGLAGKMRDAQRPLPGFDVFLDLLRRGVLKDPEFRAYLGWTGYHDALINQLIQLKDAIPPGPDLIQMVVREAFLPEMVVAAPEIFAKYMAMRGYTREWSDRYWTAHFLPIDLRQAYENLWRGYWTKEDFMFALHIADIHPRWREDIYNVAFRPPSMREMGYGWDMGVYTEEDIATYRRWAGLSEEDARKAARAMVAYRLHAEQESLRSLAVRLYKEGLDGPEEFEANLAATETPESIRPYWRARADLEAELDQALDYAGILKAAAIKGRITTETLARELGQLGFKQWKINQILADVNFRRGVDVAARPELSDAALGRLYRTKVVHHDYLVDRLRRRNWDPEEAELFARSYVPMVEAAEIEEFFKAAKISEAYAQAGLRELGITETEARSLIERWRKGGEVAG